MKDIEQWVKQQAINHVLGVDRVKKLLEAGEVSKKAIEDEVIYQVERVRAGQFLRMNAATVLKQAETAVKQKYKSIKIKTKVRG